VGSIILRSQKNEQEREKHSSDIGCDVAETIFIKTFLQSYDKKSKTTNYCIAKIDLWQPKKCRPVGIYPFWCA